MKTGLIAKIVEFQGIETYTLDDGKTVWSDVKGRWNKGDKVEVRPFIMGTIKVTKANNDLELFNQFDTFTKVKGV